MCNIFNWEDKIDESELNKIVQILNNDGVIIFPTETVYGIGGKATSLEVIEKVYNAKNRPRDKAVNILVSNKDEIGKYAIISSDLERKIIDTYMPGPITIILNKRADFGEGFTSNNDTIGIRILDNKIISAILEKINFPLIAPSANISGKPSGVKVSEIVKDFGSKVDAIIDGGDIENGVSSTIVRVESNEIKVLRQGKIKIQTKS